jgi:hypothetical protein
MSFSQPNFLDITMINTVHCHMRRVRMTTTCSLLPPTSSQPYMHCCYLAVLPGITRCCMVLATSNIPSSSPSGTLFGAEPYDHVVPTTMLH